MKVCCICHSNLSRTINPTLANINLFIKKNKTYDQKEISTQ
jgi:hypothetical protein